VVLFVLIGVGEALVQELEIKFLAHGVMDALGIVYPQYWMWLECDATFFKHLQVIKSNFYLGKTHKVDDQDMMVGELLNVNDLDCQQGVFKYTMKSNAIACMAPPFDLNPLTKCGTL
jgi:hypothetical protein